MTALLCIDLYCGLVSRQPQLARGANSFVYKFVASGAKNPNHVPLTVLHLPASVHASKLGAMGNLNNAGFSASLASFRQIRIFSIEAFHDSSTSRAARIVDALNGRLAMMKGSSLAFPSLLSAFFRAIPAIGCREHDLEMSTAYQAIPTRLGNVKLLTSAQTSSSAGAFWRAVLFVWSLSYKFTFAMLA